MRQIAELSLFVGPVRDLDDPADVCAQGVEAVVILAPERLPDPWPRDLTVMRIPLSDDGENRPADLQRAVDVIASLLRDAVATLVVCSMGMSRSVAVTALAISQHCGISPNEGLRTVAAGHLCDVSPRLWSSLLESNDIFPSE